MQAWPVQDAKAKFSEFLDACLAEGPQMVTKRGRRQPFWYRYRSGGVCSRPRDLP